MANPIGDPYEKPYQLAKHEGVTAPKSFALRRVIEAHADVLGPVCRSHNVEPEAVVAQLWVAAQKTPALLKATPESLIPSIARALETGGVIGRDVHLLVFGNEATDCVDYKYTVELVIAAGGARSIDARLVHQGDEFREELGSDPRLIHTPPKFGTARGPVIGAYAIAYFGANVPPRWVALTLAQIEAVRAKSKSWNPQKVRDCPDWYALKTAVRRLVKLLPKNPKLARVLARLDAVESAHESVEEVEAVAMPSEPLPPDVSADGEDLTYTGDEEPEAVTVALDVALGMKVNGQVLGDVRNSGLRSIIKWAHSKMQDEGESDRLANIAAACETILAAREAGTITEPAKAAKEAA